MDVLAAAAAMIAEREIAPPEVQSAIDDEAFDCAAIDPDDSLLVITPGSSRVDETATTESEPSVDRPTLPEETCRLDAFTPRAFDSKYAIDQPLLDDFTSCRTTTLPARDAPPADNDDSRGRKIGRIRHYRECDRAYGDWNDLHLPRELDRDGSTRRYDIALRRGGTLGLRPRMLSNDRRAALSESMRTCKFYRQYARSGVYHEPRFHVLLSSVASSRSSSDSGGSGYAYHGIRMKALPIDLVPEVASYARELAALYDLPDDRWDIGVDLIAYRDGEDSIGWHADDTQGESVVLCVVVDAPGEPRPVHVRPNVRTGPLSDGDEEIQLYVGEGDGYDMDGTMQSSGYEHRLPKRSGCGAHRFVLIFRHGNVASVPVDSGVAIAELAGCADVADDGDIATLFSRIRVKRPSVSFGHPQGVAEGSWYSRRYLYSTYAHRSDQRGVNGNIHFGADSIVVSRQSLDHREEDGLQWLRYTSNRRQGGSALYLSHQCVKPVRVFRSSRLRTEYAPPELDGGQTSYRYDGLYVVTSVWDATGHLMTEGNAKFPVGEAQYTFHLERLPKRLSPTEFVNSLSLLELWEKIQLSHGRSPILPFAPPRPKHHDNLPELLNDAQQQTKNFNSNTNGVTSQRLFGNSYLFSSQNAVSESPLEKWTSHQYDARLGPAPLLPWQDYMLLNDAQQQSKNFNSYTNGVTSSQNAVSESPLEKWTSHQYDERLGLAPLLPWQDYMLWTSALTKSARYGYKYERAHHYTPSSFPFQGSSLGKQQGNYQPNNVHKYNTSSNMRDARRLTCHGTWTGINTNRRSRFPSIHRSVPPLGLLSESSQLRPFLSEKAMIGEMMPYVRDRRKQPEDLHDQYKKWEEQELPVVVEFEQGYCNRPLLLSSRLQPEEIFQVWLADRKKRWRQQQQKKWPPDKVEKGELQHRWEMVDKVQDSTMLLLRRLQPERVWLADRKKKWRQWKKKWDDKGSPKTKERNSVQLTGRAILALEAFLSDSSQLILGSATRSRKKTDFHPPAHKIGSRVKQEVMGGLEAKNLRPSRKDKFTRPQMTKPTKAIEPSLKIIPRFIIDKEKRTQTVYPLLQALYFVRRKRKSHVKVTVKWGIPGKYQEKQMDANRNMSTGESMSGGTVIASRLCKSLKMPDKIVNVEQSRCIRPRFILDDENRTESLSPHLEASYSAGKRKVSHVKVTVKWGIPGICQVDSGTDEPAPSRKRKLDTVEVLFEATESDTYRRRKSSRLLRFQVNEMIFAWDKGHLYEAKVLRCRDAKDGGMEYFVHYLGYGKTHDRWLATFNMMKCTPSTREFYNDCASWPLNAV